MLNILISVLLLNITVLSFFFTYKINRVEQVFNAFEPRLISQCVSMDIDTEKYYFRKNEVIEITKYYFKENLKTFEYKLKISFREDDKNTYFSSKPNIVQIDIYANIVLDGTYTQNVRFTLDGRKVSKDWWTTF